MVGSYCLSPEIPKRGDPQTACYRLDWCQPHLESTFIEQGAELYPRLVVPVRTLAFEDDDLPHSASPWPILSYSAPTGGEERVENRIEYFERMLTDNPDNPTGLLALANEYQKAARYEDEAAVLERYVSVHSDDEGNAYARLGDVLSRLGRKDEARAVYERGVRQAEKFGHGGMAEDLRLAIVQLDEQ